MNSTDNPRLVLVENDNPWFINVDNTEQTQVIDTYDPSTINRYKYRPTALFETQVIEQFQPKYGIIDYVWLIVFALIFCMLIILCY